MIKFCQASFFRHYPSFTSPVSTLSKQRTTSITDCLTTSRNFSMVDSNPNHIQRSTHGHYTMELNTKTDYIKFVPNQEHKYSLIWLHGLGDSAHGFSDVFAD